MNAIITKLDIQTHRNILLNILLKISADPILARNLIFKWWTALYFLYNLDRFSTDLDFDLIKKWTEKIILEKLWNILKQYWEIKELRIKRYTIFALLSYKNIDHNIKIEINLRWISWNYSYKNFLWIKLNIMNLEDMCANKLIALTSRNAIANRDIYDIHFMLNKWFKFNENIIFEKTWKNLKEYWEYCIDFLKKLPKNYHVLDWLWEVLDEKQKELCKTKLLWETIFLLHSLVW